MEITIEKRAIARSLQAQINVMQGLGKAAHEPLKAGLDLFDSAFPAGVFPLCAIHEFVSYEPAHAACTNGFISGLAGKLMNAGGICLWIGNKTKIFPSALKAYGVDPDRIIFIQASKPKEVLWIIEEALKCETLSMVVGELKDLSFTDSRRMQLAIAQSGVTGFIHRYQPFRENAVACNTRWKITPLASLIDDGLPGVGHSCWDVQLLKVKNGRPSSWQVRWLNTNFVPIAAQNISTSSLQERYAG